MLPPYIFYDNYVTLAPMYDHDDDEEDFDLGPSKSQIKREMHALQELGASLVKLSNKDLAKIPMPDELAEAIAEAHSIRSKLALKRQTQYIGKLMRGLDAEPIQQALDAIRQCGQQSTAQFHAVEQWRDRIINEGQKALDEFVGLHPEADRQQLRQLMLNAAKEAKQDKPPKSARSLFKLLRELMGDDA